ncbi:type II secretion system protein N [uncultured Desulfobacter sp.]|uniref:type II secretion system protein N n=1 Tax=uncultured Desulfobacter sp. TaxID=240139 RepID=UPI0029F471E2|nr:type II secretion system protein N [uncultured Desulfobacter sp.]
MKPIFLTILAGLIILIAFQVYALVNPVTQTPKAQLHPNSQKTDYTQQHPTLNRIEPVKLNKVIHRVTQRNLFQVQVDGKQKMAPELEELNLEKTSLKLTLWGTVTGQNKEDGWAVIKDLKAKQQELYRVNDKIQGATIKAILRNRIILTVNGKDQILEVDENPLSSNNRKRQFSDRRPTTPTPRQSAPDRPGIPDNVSQSNQLFKTRPYFRNGEASGVMIYSIKRGSVAQLLGLRNGDIIQAVDDVEIQNVQDLEDFDENIDEQSDMTISILRRGKAKELVFSAQDNAHSVNDVEQ